MKAAEHISAIDTSIENHVLCSPSYRIELTSDQMPNKSFDLLLLWCYNIFATFLGLVSIARRSGSPMARRLRQIFVCRGSRVAHPFREMSHFVLL